jgi:hypothetical protein
MMSESPSPSLSTPFNAVSFYCRLVIIFLAWMVAAASIEHFAILDFLIIVLMLPLGISRWMLSPESEVFVPSFIVASLYHVMLIGGILIPRRRIIWIICGVLLLITLTLDVQGCKMVIKETRNFH